MCSVDCSSSSSTLNAHWLIQMFEREKAGLSLEHCFLPHSLFFILKLIVLFFLLLAASKKRANERTNERKRERKKLAESGLSAMRVSVRCSLLLLLLLCPMSSKQSELAADAFEHNTHTHKSGAEEKKSPARWQKTRKLRAASWNRFNLSQKPPAKAQHSPFKIILLLLLLLLLSHKSSSQSRVESSIGARLDSTL